MLWKREISIQQVFSSPKYIDVHIDEGQGRKWRPTGIYGEPRWEDKYKTWDKMRELKHDSTLPWLILGDFNEIMFSHEKEGGNQRPSAFMQAFRDALMDCDLEDLGFQGEKFTWKRGRIRERLDHVICNGSWVMMYPMARVHHLAYIRSDHLPILLDT
jgi:endonuclease/exonuclease/phosphatase family metal-dependent hydrolase